MNELLDYIKEDWFDNNLTRLLASILIVVVTFFLRFLFVKAFNRFIILKANELSNDPTNYKFLKHSISALIYIIGFSFAIYTIPSLRTIANSMLAGAGILAVAIGFASQQAFSNIISGVFIILFKPFRVNDRLVVRDTIAGVVEDITLRHTIIRNYENRRVIIPNSVISQEVLINSDIIEDKICKIIDLGISYDSDIKKARQIIQEEATNHPFFIDNRNLEQKENNENAVNVRVMAWADSAITLRVWVWAKDAPSAFVMGCELLESIKERFDKEGIEIPFPHRTLVYKNKLDDKKD